jgi:ribonuclease HI
MCPRDSSRTGELFATSPKTIASAYTAHIDGGARGNPGPAGYGVVIHDPAGRAVAELSEYLGHHTNNYAEYQGLLAALRYAQDNGIKALKVISDSELMVRQMKGVYKVKHPELRKLYDEAQPLVRKLEHFEIRHALREHNQDADRLANEAMDRGRSGGAKSAVPSPRTPTAKEEFEGVVRNGVIEVVDGVVPDGTRVQIRVRR